jgi:hypothetical protein
MVKTKNEGAHAECPFRLGVLDSNGPLCKLGWSNGRVVLDEAGAEASIKRGARVLEGRLGDGATNDK